MPESKECGLTTLGDGLVSARERKGMSQDELAKKTDLSRNYISLLERGQRNPSYTTLKKIVEALEADARELF